MKYTYYNQSTKIENATWEEFAAAIVSGGSDVNINKENALKNSDVIFSCVNYISSMIAKMPISLYENTDSGKVKVDNDLISMIKNRPNPYLTYTDLISALVCNMLIYGNGFAKIITRSGKVTELQILEPSNTTLEKANGKWFVKTYIDSKQEVLNYNQVIHIRDLTTDGVQGISRVDIIKSKAINRANADKKLSEYFNEGNQTVKGIITAPLKSDESKEKVKIAFNNILKNGKDGVAVLSEGYTYNSIPYNSLLDMDFVNTLTMTKGDLCTVFGINPALLGSSKEATNSNMRVMVEDFVKSLQPLINKIESEFTYKLLPQNNKNKMYFKLNMSTVLRGNDLERAAYYKDMFRNGFMTQDEIRDLEDMNDLPNKLGEKFYRDLNLVQCDIANEYQLSKSGILNQGE